MRHGLPILERAAEQAALEQLLADANAARGHVLVVESPPGSGKTTLARYALELAHEAGVRTLHATGSELESGFPYGMARQMLEPALEGLTRTQRERVLAGPAGLAKRALGEEISFSRGATQAHAAVHGLFRLSVNLAAEAPLLMIADDAQWGDFGSLQFLYYLARRVGGIPLGLLIATRPIDASDAPSPQ